VKKINFGKKYILLNQKAISHLNPDSYSKYRSGYMIAIQININPFRIRNLAKNDLQVYADTKHCLQMIKKYKV